MRCLIDTFFAIVPKNETFLTRLIPNNTGKNCFCSFSIHQKQDKSLTESTYCSKEPPVESDLPPKPKLPTGFFIRFCLAMEPKILRDNPTFTPKDVRIYAGEMWRKADAEAKLPYQKEYYTELEKYYVDMAEYESNLTEKQIIALKTSAMRKKELRIRKKLKNEFKDFAKPKRPPASFALYMASRKDDLKNKNAKGYMNQLTKDWHELPKKEKKVFNEKSEKLWEEYRKKLAEWKAQKLNFNYDEAINVSKKKSNKKEKTEDES